MIGRLNDRRGFAERGLQDKIREVGVFQGGGPDEGGGCSRGSLGAKGDIIMYSVPARDCTGGADGVCCAAGCWPEPDEEPACE